MSHSKLALLVFPLFLLLNCGDKNNLDALVSINTIEIRKDFLLGDSPELQI